MGVERSRRQGVTLKKTKKVGECMLLNLYSNLPNPQKTHIKKDDSLYVSKLTSMIIPTHAYSYIHVYTEYRNYYQYLKTFTLH